jgi:hypothetical protein
MTSSPVVQYTSTPEAAYRTSKPVELSLVDRLRQQAIDQRPLYTRMFHGEEIESISRPMDTGYI